MVKKFLVTLLVIIAGLLACWAARAERAPDAGNLSFGNFDLVSGLEETGWQPQLDWAAALPDVFDTQVWEEPAPGAYWHSLSSGLFLAD
jgi:hypothetical protein